MRCAAVALALAAIGWATPAAAEILVTAGEVTATSAVVWARAPSAGSVLFDLSAAAARDVAVTARAEAAAPSDFTARAVFSGLRPATRYAYRIRHGAESARGEFTTAPAPDDAARVSFLWSGDLGGGGFCRLLDGGYRIFRTMASHPADFFLFVGDTIYADVPCDRPGVVPGAAFRAQTLGEYHARHRYNREDAAVQALFRAVPVYAIWDDHEVRNDFSGPTEALMAVGRQAFVDYWPLTPPPDDPSRLYRSVRWGRRLEVFILDTRQYRSPNAEADGPAKTMLGEAQRRWLLAAVASSTATWKVIVSSVTLSVPTGRPERRDGWTGSTIFGIPPAQPTGFVRERDAILAELHARGVRNVVVVAADVHHAEVIRHEPSPGFVLHELIAGPLSATLGRPRPLDEALNPRSLFAQGGVYNFGAVSVDASGLTVRLVDEQGTVMFSHTIAAR